MSPPAPHPYEPWWYIVIVILLTPVTLPLLLLLAALSIPYFMIYPDRHATTYDGGIESQQETIRRYRRFAARVSFWRRVGRVLAFPFRSQRSRRTGHST